MITMDEYEEAPSLVIAMEEVIDNSVGSGGGNSHSNSSNITGNEQQQMIQMMVLQNGVKDDDGEVCILEQLTESQRNTNNANIINEKDDDDSDDDDGETVPKPPHCVHGPTILFTDMLKRKTVNLKRKGNYQQQSSTISDSDDCDGGGIRGRSSGRGRRKFPQKSFSSATPAVTTVHKSSYYACSASRDVRYCNFRMEQSKWLALSDERRAEYNARRKPPPRYELMSYLFDDDDDTATTAAITTEEDAQQCQPPDSNVRYAFCVDCSRILVQQPQPLPNNRALLEQHLFGYHLTLRCAKLLSNLTREHFHLPCKVLQANTDNQAQAQYFFDNTIVDYIIDHLIYCQDDDAKRYYDRVLCIGCPTIHERLIWRQVSCGKQHHNTTPSQEPPIRSFLLDIDIRFAQFYSPKQYAQFNMFNGYFFSDVEGKKELKRFLASGPAEKTLVLCDPPFGGMVQYLAKTLKRLFRKMMPPLSLSKADSITDTNDTKTSTSSAPYPSKVPTMLFFPYFNEHWITKAFDGTLRITDMLITYANHVKFRGLRGRLPVNRGEACTIPPLVLSSPVRLYTNIDRSQIDLTKLNTVLGAENFYRRCTHCERDIFHNNRHCMECGQCTARDATKVYRHCSQCSRCVKNTWNHCQYCRRCHLGKICDNIEMSIAKFGGDGDGEGGEEDELAF